MVQNNLRVKAVSKVAVYHALRKKHRANKRWFYVGQSLLLLSALVLSILLQSFFPLTASQRYELSPEMYSLVGESRDDAKEHLKLSEQGSGYEFVVPETTNSTAHEHTGRVEDAYSATLSTDAKEGITVTDTKTKIAITLIPDFFTQNAQKVEGDHIVYPTGANKLVYTLKYNGLKEDIILPEFQGDSLEYKFKLQLPSGVEAKLDEQGNIGIYSADPTLYGNISFGTDNDRELMDKARQNGKKNNLVMTVPFPIVKDAKGKEYSDRAKFELSESSVKSQKSRNENLPPGAPETVTKINIQELTLSARNLKDLPYPISLDPTIKVTNAGEFSALNAEYGTSVDSGSSLIKRASLTGGAVGTWTNDSGGDFTTARSLHASVAHNGYLYVLGGTSDGSTALNTIYYAPIDSSACVSAGAGCIGTWASAGTLHTATAGAGVAIYNGYMYIIGGSDGTNAIATTQRAAINANGTLGTWTTTGMTVLNTARAQPGVAAYNGYIYTTGGANNLSLTTTYTSSEYAPLNGDGSIGTWTTDAGGDFTTTRAGHASVIYNGYVYVMGGANSSTYHTSTYVAPLGTDGSIGTWRSTTSLPAVRAHMAAAVSNGYVYLTGGCSSGSCTGYLSSVVYAPINADGSVGTWRDTSAVSGARMMHGSAVYEGFVFSTGGCTAGAPCNTRSTNSQYAPIKLAGEIHNESFTNDSDTFADASFFHSTVVYNGYMYVIGGCTTDHCTNFGIKDTVRYAPLNTDGSIGSFTTDGQVLGQARYGGAAFAYDGFLFYVGGCETTGIGGNQGICNALRNNIYYSPIGSSGNPGAWISDTANQFSNARYGHASVVYNGYVYVIGGCSAATSQVCTTPAGYENDVQVATISLSNCVAGNTSCVGAFSAEDSFSITRFFHDAFAYNGYLYISGGRSDGTDCSDAGTSALCNDVQYAPIASDGTISAWSTDTGGFSTGRYAHSFVIDKGYAYIIAGCSAQATNRCSTLNNDVQYALVNSDGTMGSWTTTQTISTARMGQTAFIQGGSLRVAGGCTTVGTTDASFSSCGGFNAQVQYQAVNNGGTGEAGSWTDASNNFTTARDFHGSVIHNGYLYVVAGCQANATCTLTDIRYIQLKDDGTLTGQTWQQTTQSLSANRNGFAIAIVGNYLYIIGGRSDHNNNTAQSTVYYAPIDSGGNITTAFQTTGALNGTRAFIDAVVHDGTIYVAAGLDATGTSHTSTQYATPAGDGTIASTWNTDSTNPLPIGLQRQTMATNGGYVYVLGGGTSACSSGEQQTVYGAQVLGDKTLSAWTELPHLAEKRVLGKAVAMNGQLYYIGGCEAGNSRVHVYMTSLLQGGGIQTWEGQTDLPTNLSRQGIATYNGKIYITGGISGGVQQATVYYTAPQSISRAGSFSKLYDFDVGVKPNKVITRGTKRTSTKVKIDYKTVNNTSSSFTNSQNNSDIGYAGANALTLSLGTNVTLSQYLLLRYTIDETSSAIFPDTGNESTITDFDVYYMANPGKRLRGGRTFTNGIDRGLQANP